MSLFKDAALPGFTGTGLSNAVNWSSVGVCPGAQAAKAKRAREETPLFVNALTSSTVRETSAALLLRALVDSRDVLMLLNFFMFFLPCRARHDSSDGRLFWKTTK